MTDFQLHCQTAVDAVNAGPSLLAAARRRRMHHRTAKRRASRMAVGIALTFVLGAVVAPRVTTVAGDGDAAEGLSAVAGSTTTTWRPAGDVLARKASVSPSLPFALDPRVLERQASLVRWHRIHSYSSRYRISPELARKVYDAAVAQSIEPELAFRLVRVESVFDPRAVSPVGALGLTQLMEATAREFEPSVTRERLLDAETNLRIGFRYLRALIREHKGNLRLALLTYNRGPVAVQNALNTGRDPANGYESVVMRGYRGRGTLD